MKVYVLHDCGYNKDNGELNGSVLGVFTDRKLADEYVKYNGGSEPQEFDYVVSQNTVEEFTVDDAENIKWLQGNIDEHKEDKEAQETAQETPR